MTNKKFALIDTLNPGLFTTIQDKGRVGWQAHGVSVSGAADLNSMMIAIIRNYRARMIFMRNPKRISSNWKFSIPMK